jgi:uncharacterized membrane protein YphA (DoxX/SURF4 family)
LIVAVLVRFMSRLTDFWALAVRFSAGFFWLYFASQRWFDVSWVKDLYITAAANNYIPLYGELLRSLAGDWFTLAVVVTVAETAIGFMMILGVFPRVAGGLGALIAANLLLTFSFCDCPWNAADAPMVFWFYFSAALLNLAVLREQHKLLVLWRRPVRRS